MINTFYSKVFDQKTKICKKYSSSILGNIKILPCSGAVPLLQGLNIVLCLWDQKKHFYLPDPPFPQTTLHSQMKLSREACNTLRPRHALQRSA